MQSEESLQDRRGTAEDGGDRSIDRLFTIVDNPKVLIGEIEDEFEIRRTVLKEILNELRGTSSLENLWRRGVGCHALIKLMECNSNLRGIVLRDLSALQSLADIVRDCDTYLKPSKIDSDAFKMSHDVLSKEIVQVLQTVKLNACFAISQLQRGGDCPVRFDRSLLCMTREFPLLKPENTNYERASRQKESKRDVTIGTSVRTKIRGRPKVCHSTRLPSKNRNGVLQRVADQIVEDEFEVIVDTVSYQRPKGSSKTKSRHRRDPDAPRRAAVFSAKQHVNVDVTNTILALQNLSDAAALHEKSVKKQRERQMSENLTVHKYAKRDVFVRPRKQRVESLRPGVGIELPNCLVLPEDEQRIMLNPWLQTVSLQIDTEKFRPALKNPHVMKTTLPPIESSELSRRRIGYTTPIVWIPERNRRVNDRPSRTDSAAALPSALSPKSKAVRTKKVSQRLLRGLREGASRNASDVAESWIYQRARNEYESKVLKKMQAAHMNAALDSLPLSFLLREISELTFSRVCGLEYIRQRVHRALSPLWKYLNQTALRARFLRWLRTTRNLAQLERHGRYAKKMAATRIYQLFSRIQLKVSVHRKRRALQLWRAFKEFATWKIEESALVRLQARMRGIVSRIRLARHLLRVRMAIRIQSIARMRPAIRMLTEARHAATVIEANVRMLQASRHYALQRRSIFKIQGSWLCLFHWRRYMRARWAANIIRRNLRWWQIERTVAQRSKARLRRREICLGAAAQIQRFWRGFRDRKRVRSMEKAKEERFKRVFDAAIAIQRAWYFANGYAGRFALCSALRAKHEQEERAHRMKILFLRLRVACRLQAIFRGKLARTRMKRIRQYRDAACVLQKLWRGYVRRRAFRATIRRERSSRKLQRWIRGVIRARHDAARTIQLWHWRVLTLKQRRAALMRQREWSERVKTRIRFAVRVRSSARTIQNFVRSVWARRVYLRLVSGKKIVAAARGFFGRQRVRRIHAYVRRKVARVYVRKLFARVLPDVLPNIWWRRRNAKQIVQRALRRYIRGWRQRHRSHIVRLQNTAARTLQSQWRRRAAAALYANRLRMRHINRSNKFDDCLSAGDVLRALSDVLKNIYDPLDPLVGISLPSLLRRVGALSILPKFQDSLRAHIFRSPIDIAQFCAPPNNLARQLKAPKSERRRRRAFDKILELGTNRLLSTFELDERADKNACDQIVKLMVLNDLDTKRNACQYANGAFAREAFLRRFPRSETRARNFAEAIDALQGCKRVSRAAVLSTISSAQVAQDVRDAIKSAGGLIQWSSQTQRSDEILSRRARRQRYQDLVEQAIYKIESTFRQTDNNLFFDLSSNLRTHVVDAMKLALAPLSKKMLKSGAPHAAAMLQDEETSSGFAKGRACALALREILDDIQRRDDAARKIQCRVRCIMAKRVSNLVRTLRNRGVLMAEYVNERQGRVREAFKKEVEEHRKEAIRWKISSICRYPWESQIDQDTSQAYYVNSVTGKTSWVCPSYSVEEYDAAEKIQTVLRGYLGRLHVRKIREAIRLNEIRDAEIKKWAAAATIRMQPTTLSTSFVRINLPELSSRTSADATIYAYRASSSSSSSSIRPLSSSRRPTSSSRPLTSRRERLASQRFQRRIAERCNLEMLRGAWSFRRQTRSAIIVDREEPCWGDRAIGRRFRSYVTPAFFKPLERRYVSRLTRDLLTRALENVWSIVDRKRSERLREKEIEEDTALMCKIKAAELRAGLELVGFGLHSGKYMRWVRAKAGDWASRNIRDDATDPQVRRFTEFMRTSAKLSDQAVEEVAALREALQKQQSARIPWWSVSKSKETKPSETTSRKSARNKKRKQKTTIRNSSTSRKSANTSGDKHSVISISLVKIEGKSVKSDASKSDGDEKRRNRKRRRRKKKRNEGNGTSSSSSSLQFCRILAEYIFSESVHRAITYIDAQHQAISLLTRDIVAKAIQKAYSKEMQRIDALESQMMAMGTFEGRVMSYDPSSRRYLVETYSHHVAVPRRRLLWCKLNENTEWIDGAATTTCTLRISMRVSWLCRYGWECVRDDSVDAYYYWNRFSGESTYKHPDYTYDELEACLYIQRSYRAFAGKRAFRRIVRNSGPCRLLRDAVRRAAETAWIRYGNEGITASMWLARIGVPEIASLLTPKTNVRMRLGMKQRSIDLAYLKQMNETKLSHLGIADKSAIAQIRRMATSPDCERRALALVVSEKESRVYCALGEKTWVESISDRGGPLPLFRKMFPNQSIRCRAFVRDVLGLRPIMSLGALEYHLSKCVNKPRLAQDGIHQYFLGSNFTSSPKDVHAALDILTIALKRAEVLFANMHVDVMRARIRATLDKTGAILQTLKSAKKEREEKKRSSMISPRSSIISTSPVSDDESIEEDASKENDVESTSDEEAEQGNEWNACAVEIEAALECRKCIATIFKWERMIVRLQSLFRGHKKHVIWMQYKYVRYNAALRIQTRWRAVSARQLAQNLRNQYESPWEQCWDATDGVYYYFNTKTNETSWELPSDDIPFRPEGWWAHLSKSRRQSERFQVSKCDVCGDREAIRSCRECSENSAVSVLAGGSKLPQQFCLKCYHKSHASSEMREHSFEVCSHTDALSLVCSARDCPGRLSDAHQSHALASRYCYECDAMFCGKCFTKSHPVPKKLRGLRCHEPRPSGKWQHRWRSLRPGVAACNHCEKKLGERRCLNCDDIFCEDCFASLHKHGHRKHHKWEVLKEPIPRKLDVSSESSAHCSECEFNVARRTCRYCRKTFCVGCYLQHELRECPDKFPSDHPCMLGSAACVECGKPAERICIQCGEAYCDQRWFGNPGCFEWFHRRGQLRKHKCRVHPRGEIVKACVLIQSCARRYLCYNKVLLAKRESCARRLQRAWRSHALKKATWESLGIDMGIRGLLKMKIRRARGFVRRVGRAALGKPAPLPPRLRVRLEVLERWKATDTRAELKRFIKEGLEKHEVASDRHDFLLKQILKDVMEEKKRKLQEIEAKDNREMKALESRINDKAMRS